MTAQIDYITETDVLDPLTAIVPCDGWWPGCDKATQFGYLTWIDHGWLCPNCVTTLLTDRGALTV